MSGKKILEPWEVNGSVCFRAAWMLVLTPAILFLQEANPKKKWTFALLKR